MLRDPPTLLLNGFMGSGKSTVGPLVAERAGVPFVDLDAAVVARAGASVPQIFAAEGEAGLRRREADELSRLLAEPGRRVVALGGGALLDPVRRRAALAQTRVVTLTARAETVAARTSGPGRPLLEGALDRLGKIRELLAIRADAYAETHARVATDGVAPEAVAIAVLEAWARPAVAVPLGGRSYAVRFASSEPDVVSKTVAELAPSQTFLITDANVQHLWGEVLGAALARHGARPQATVVLSPGEEHKRLGSVERALTAMVEAGADRDAVVIGHGGGVVTDVAGFTAATLLRGVRWVAVPTTLLAMVDASVGGKTGVDLGASKNAVGAFHQPSGVVVDVARVATESARAYASGLAEVVKSAAIGDAELFERLESRAEAVVRREPRCVEELALRSVAVKAAIVARDEREAGDRALLNFGHTVGHALEAQGGFTRLTHGEAVALGMVAALRVGVALGVTDAQLAERVTRLLGRLGLPADLDAQPVAEALPLMALDKKRRRGAIRFVLLRGLGDAMVRELDPASLTPILAR
jgi:shikimate kinase/3-dehydroquinate synthase